MMITEKRRKQANLVEYNNYPYNPGGSAIKRVLWYYVNVFFFKSSLFPFYGFKNSLLRLFGAKVGKQVEIKPCVNIKYPWLLTIGNEVWIGENVWIDSLVMVTIGSNVCLSQGVTILTGSHNYKKSSFDLITASVVLEDGVWLGAGSVVNLGVTAGTHSVLSSGAVATKNLEPYSVYQGNPAVKIRERVVD
ncbi:MAG TPA: WcaF family extracellular polysaccharide biosynthesis acetyltransferase [Mucilaginibacter sp.]|nr:WcaF family extracellular polysaccharide biosynthesis acetyltransferase [Mucilaginibacter sp.]